MVVRLLIAIAIWVVAIGCAGLTGLLYSEAKYLNQSKQYSHGRLNGLMSFTTGAAALFLLFLGLIVVKAI